MESHLMDSQFCFNKISVKMPFSELFPSFFCGVSLIESMMLIEIQIIQTSLFQVLMVDWQAQKMDQNLFSDE